WDLKNTQNREVSEASKLYRSEDTEEGARLIAHKFADAIVEVIGGGVHGIAQTKIAYVTERIAKELSVMDYDGNAATAMTAYKSIIMTPAWSPDGDKIAFTSFQGGSSNIAILGRIDRRNYPFE